MNNELNKLALAITKALAYTENGGHVSLDSLKAGKSGEMKSIFQFLPSTWKRQSKEITGKDNLPLTPENEAAVAYGVISPLVEKGIKEGKHPDEIATEIGSFWNSGRTDGAKKGLIGTNKKGVKYDVPAYAKKVVDYTNQFLNQPEQKNENQQANTVTDTSTIPMIENQKTIANTTNPLGNISSKLPGMIA